MEQKELMGKDEIYLKENDEDILKQYTVEDIMENLSENMSLEYDAADDVSYYYINLDKNGELLKDKTGEEWSFREALGFEPEDDSYDWETPENPFFKEVAEELTKKVNAWLEYEDIMVCSKNVEKTNKTSNIKKR